jgi:hypothetical protein
MPYIPSDIVDLTGQLITNPGNPNALYELPNASMKVLEAIINATWNLGNESKYDFTTKTAALTAAIDAIIAGSSLDISDTQVSVPTVTAPNVTIPSTMNVGDIYSDFATEYVALGTWLDSKFTALKATYFPNDTATYAAAESWVQGALANPNGGIPLAVQSQILADDQARIVTETARAKDSLMATFAARRFPLPSGAAVSAALQLDQSAQDKMAESSRKVSIMSVEQMKFAVQTALSMRDKCMSAAIEYMKGLAASPDMSSRLVGVGYDAQSKLISAASQWYSADANAKEMISKVNQFNSTLALDADSKNQAADIGLIDGKIKALLSEAGAIAQMATSQFNNLHASVSLQAGGSTISTTAQDGAL